MTVSFLNEEMTVYKKRAAVSKIHMLKATRMQDFLFFSANRRDLRTLSGSVGFC